ncbi:hypothetical protein H8K52_09690 [Undibacterium seohonense]|jgi:hypothetical protein|uniref:Uncharacterized protein n=1 Tax=Undibacterium seohonense TaxID=1344950 RepID=A0ABR6X4J0_9BURK|nr:hypothetical protein [Undibacterium seohonense]MBC3807613.1 hypothetical protein [Undibacterium seohonense]
MNKKTSNIHRDAQHNKHGLGFVEFLVDCAENSDIVKEGKSEMRAQFVIPA